MTLLSDLCLIILLIYTISNHNMEPFTEPDIIKDNVQFWKKIYSEIPTDQGLLHDRDYPLVIYEKIDFSSISEEERRSHINSRKKFYANLLKNITESPQLDEDQKRVLKLFKTCASEQAINEAENRIRFQYGQMQRFKIGLERSFMYLDTISSILKKYGLPDKLKYLPHVESSFDPNAYSKAGATGMWQFMHYTGKLFLNINHDIDERLDPILATDAAARLLNYNYEQLKSWPLAITAYNHGLNGIKKAVNTIGTNNFAEILVKHKSPSFQFASKNYYASFIAAMHLADSAFHYFPDLAPHRAFTFKSLTIETRITPDQLCQTAGITLDLLKQYNPAIKANVYHQQKSIPSGYTVSLPDTINIEKLAISLALIKPDLAQETSDKADYYTVCKGDNIISIARKFGTSPRELAELNSIDKLNFIYEGQQLRLPHSAEITSAVIAAIPDTNVLDTAVSLVDTVCLNDSSQIDSSDHHDISIFIKENLTAVTSDTLLALKLDSSVSSTEKKQIQEDPFNRFDSSFYDLGLELVYRGTTALVKVNHGETVLHYSQLMNLTVSSIMRINNMKNYRLKPGRKLLLPIGADSDLKKFQKKRLEFLKSVENRFYSSFEVVDLLDYTIKRGDSFKNISSQSNIPVWLLKKANGNVNISTPKKGTIIKIPIIRARPMA